VGNAVGGKAIKTNKNWFQPKKFTSVFTKPYGQKILQQTIIGAGISGNANIVENLIKNTRETIKKFIEIDSQY